MVSCPICLSGRNKHARYVVLDKKNAVHEGSHGTQSPWNAIALIRECIMPQLSQIIGSNTNKSFRLYKQALMALAHDHYCLRLRQIYFCCSVLAHNNRRMQATV